VHIPHTEFVFCATFAALPRLALVIAIFHAFHVLSVKGARVDVTSIPLVPTPGDSPNHRRVFHDASDAFRASIVCRVHLLQRHAFANNTEVFFRLVRAWVAASRNASVAIVAAESLLVRWRTKNVRLALKAHSWDGILLSVRFGIEILRANVLFARRTLASTDERTNLGHQECGTVQVRHRQRSPLGESSHDVQDRKIKGYQRVFDSPVTFSHKVQKVFQFFFS